MKKSLKNQVLSPTFLRVFLCFCIVLISCPKNLISKSYNCNCDCGCSCGLHGAAFDCPDICRHCYDCPKPCECRPIHPCHGAPFLQYRSQSLNKAKEISGWQSHIYRYGKEELNGSLYTSIEFTSSFRSNWIAQYLFGNDLINGNSLIIQGSSVEDRHPNAWLADYFGLPTDFESIVLFCPKIKNIIVDLNTYLGLDRIVQGLYLKFHFPIASTRWELNMSECIKNPGQKPFKIGYMGLYVENDEGEQETADIPRKDLPCGFVDAMQIGTTFGDQKSSMLFGTMPCKQLKKTRFSDIHATLGYNFLLKEDKHLGAYLHVAAPTGNRPDAIYFFEPIVGNGKHWELGLGISGSWIFWRHQENEQRYAGIWFDAVATHMFKACQARSFDFCGKPNSRYMLLVEMMDSAEFTEAFENDGSLEGADTFTDILTPDNPVTANYVYSYNKNSDNNTIYSKIIPAVNYTTRIVDSRVTIQADVAMKLGFKIEDFTFDIGYNFWYRTKEKITPCCDYCKREPDPRYVIKGDAQLWGFSVLANTTLSGSQSNADIHTGQNMKLKATNATDAARNKGVDNPKLTWLFNTIAGAAFDPVLPAPDSPVTTDNIIYSSFQPILVSIENIDTCHSAKALTHKFFVHINYEWRDPEGEWRPFAGVGAETEFAPKDRKYRAISQWGVWVKAGVAFK